MAVPTEQLDADIRDLERRLGTRIDNVDRSLSELREEFSGFRSRMNVIVAILSAGTLLVFGSASMVWAGLSSLQRELGRNETTIANLDKRLEASIANSDKKFELMMANSDKRFDSITEKLNRLSEDLARLQGRLDRDPATPKPVK